MHYYYHAGSQRTDSFGEVCVNWSNHTRRAKDVAEAEARKIARREGGKAVVEYWDKKHGLRPGWDCAEGAYDVVEGKR